MLNKIKYNIFKPFVVKKFILLTLVFLGFALNTFLFSMASVGATPYNSDCSINQGLCATCYKQGQCITSTPINSNCTTSNCDLVKTYLDPTVNVLSSMVALVVVASIIWAGIQYTSSEGDPQKVAKAKSRITNSIIAFLVFILLYAFLQFIIPGGLLNK